METSTPDQSMQKKRVIVLGAGVAGLTTALKIQEKGGYQVEIIADVLPTDPKTIKYTSQWAGAHFVSSAAAGTREADIAHKTFLEMWALSEPGSPAEDCFLRIVQTEFNAEEQTKPSPFEGMPEFREVPKKELPPGATCGYSFQTVTIDVSLYLNYLTTQLLEKGVVFVRHSIQHIDQVLEAGSSTFRTSGSEEDEVDATRSEPPDAVIVCVGVGARFLGGVEDRDVYPSRGQTVILRAPWVRFGRTFEDDVHNSWTYIIPRKGGNVVIGGVQGIDDWYPRVRPETTKDILKRGLALCPELIPPEIRIKRGDNPGEIDDLIPLIVEEGCGLRPMRKGGPRIELEYATTPGRGGTAGRKVAVIHNYGHGPRGYIQSIGSAELVLGLLEEALAQ